jgi:hypothetical protein
MEVHKLLETGWVYIGIDPRFGSVIMEKTKREHIILLVDTTKPSVRSREDQEKYLHLAKMEILKIISEIDDKEQKPLVSLVTYSPTKVRYQETSFYLDLKCFKLLTDSSFADEVDALTTAIAMEPTQVILLTDKIKRPLEVRNVIRYNLAATQRTTFSCVQLSSEIDYEMEYIAHMTHGTYSQANREENQ